MDTQTAHVLLVVLPAAAVVSLPSFLLVLVLWRGMGRAVAAIEKGFSREARIGAIDARVAELNKRLADFGKDMTLGFNRLRGEVARVEDMLVDHRQECSEREDEAKARRAVG